MLNEFRNIRLEGLFKLDDQNELPNISSFTVCRSRMFDFDLQSYSTPTSHFAHVCLARVFKKSIRGKDKRKKKKEKLKRLRIDNDAKTQKTHKNLIGNLCQCKAKLVNRLVLRLHRNT
jgi:hypothetical protein